MRKNNINMTEQKLNEIGKEIKLQGIFGELWDCVIEGHNYAVAKNGKAEFYFRKVDGDYVVDCMLDLSRISKAEF